MLIYIKVIFHIFLLYIIFFAGNQIQQMWNMMVPGSVIGMILLFFLLLTGIIKVTWIKEGASFLMNHLTLFFIPVTVGIMDYSDLFKGKGFLLILIVILSTFIVMGASGLVSQWLAAGKETDNE